ncbi:MAG: head-tail connector protein, partial [Thermaurantiacus sp.]
VSTVAQSAYDLRTDAGGRSVIRFDADYAFPTGLHESRAVAVTFVAGYETIPAVPGEEGPPVVEAVPAKSTVPASLKVAIMMMVANWYENREAVVVGPGVSELPLGAKMLIDQFKRVGL